VVGVVEDTRYSGVLDQPSLMYYLPVAQEPGRGRMRGLLVRLRGDDTDAGIRAVRDALLTIDPGLPHVQAELLEARVAPALVPWRLGAVMFAAFGILALVLATLGLYGVVSYDVAQRRREMGVRAALGARAGSVLRLVIGDAARVVVPGLVIGLAASAIATRWVEPLLFNTSARDPLVHTGAATLLLAVALAAAAVPAWRAARIQPTEALRDD
jgi:ABC-type antimicrobial peptide transport system permease subunit